MWQMASAIIPTSLATGLAQAPMIIQWFRRCGQSRVVFMFSDIFLGIGSLFPTPNFSQIPLNVHVFSQGFGVTTARFVLRLGDQQSGDRRSILSQKLQLHTPNHQQVAWRNEAVELE